MMPGIHRKAGISGVSPTGRYERDEQKKDQKGGDGRKRRSGGRHGSAVGERTHPPVPLPEDSNEKDTGKHIDIRV